MFVLIKQTNVLRDAFGDDIILLNASYSSESHRILAEFKLDDQLYVVLQTASQRNEDEPLFMRVTQIPQEPYYELENIENDEEWENVAETYDELLFSAVASDEELD
jgi:hypothetical protein